MTAYCDVGDLLTGDIPIPQYLDPTKRVQDAADEIDSTIGFVYVTPVVLPDTPESRPARLLLKRINAHLATGRLLMEAAAASEDTALHAYGLSLVNQSLAALSRIVDREIILDGADIIITDGPRPTGPLQYNKDPFSQVDAFYDEIALNPHPWWIPVRLPNGG